MAPRSRPLWHPESLPPPARCSKFLVFGLGQWKPRPVLIPLLQPQTVAPCSQPCLGLLGGCPGRSRFLIFSLRQWLLVLSLASASWEVAPAGLDSSSSAPYSGSSSSALPRLLGRLPRPVMIPHHRTQTVAPNPQPCLGLLRVCPRRPDVLNSLSLVSGSGCPGRS